MMQHWANDAVFYHIYPLGFCGAPASNDFHSQPVPRLNQLYDWIGHLSDLGVNALYLGPVFESSTHGYDTADYFYVDRRLGDKNTLATIISALHENGIRVILDGVFNHVGRNFWAFRDLCEHREQSPFRDWFCGVNFQQSSPFQDPFSYEGWNGHYELVKMNLVNPDVKAHLLHAVGMWIQDFNIDGLRLDVADSLDINFIKELAVSCRRARSDFWLMGEVIHGDYRQWANQTMLNSVTNYECYKGLYSSHVEKNFYEIAYSLNRQFGETGLYRGLPLYNFADNHDVNRVASSLKNPAHLFTLYCLLFTMPGVPSVYYGSEWGISGVKNNGDDRPLRPYLDLKTAQKPYPELAKLISRLSAIRHNFPALRYGAYRQLSVSHEQLAFTRETGDECVVVLINAADKAAPLTLTVPGNYGNKLIDLLNPGDEFPINNRQANINAVWPHWARILAVK